MPYRISRVMFLMIFAALMAISVPSTSISQDENPQARKMMEGELQALKTADYQQFIQNGNSAFKELSKTVFDVLEMSWSEELAKGYQLDYLGAIERVGMTEYLWRVTFTGSNSQHLGRLTLADGKIAGFNLD